ncbi:Sau3AI family type II restriction endonuclease [Dubosiella newyorkensis]|nr:Sau3AI family type II restriction endonuclease [Dubosiella newyorkensis]
MYDIIVFNGGIVMLFDYDFKDPESIYRYALYLRGKTFKEIFEEYLRSPKKSYFDQPTYPLKVKEDKYVYLDSSKGQLGNFLEKYYFGYDPNGRAEADFKEAGIELKQTPVDKGKKGELRAGERLSITNISYEEPVIEDFYESHVWEKIHRILLVQYLRDKAKNRLDYEILFVNLFTPPKEDLEIIKQDYYTIIEKVKAGKAQDLSEGDTTYLGACTKGSNAEKSWRRQFYPDHALAKKRNFCLKQSYMNYVLREYVLKDKVPYEPIIKDIQALREKGFDELITEKIDRYVGLTDKELCQRFSREYNNNKAQWSDLAYRMLDIKSNHAEEFVKAGIKVKTVRIEQNGKIKESWPLPPIVFKDLINEDWEHSELYRALETEKYLFVVFKYNGTSYTLLGSQLWNMPQKDIEDKVRPGWEKIKRIVQEGVDFIPKIEKSGKVTYANNLPKKSENEVIHIRPHAPKAAYRFFDGTVIGDLKHADELPDGQMMTKQSFWINNDYLLSQLKFK